MEHEKRASVELMHERYEYWENVPKPGLFIDGKPAITQIDKGMIGDYTRWPRTGKTRLN